MKRSVKAAAIILTTFLLVSCGATSDVTVHSRTSSSVSETNEATIISESTTFTADSESHVATSENAEASEHQSVAESANVPESESSVEHPQTNDTDGEELQSDISESEADHAPPYADNYHGHVYTGGQYSKKYHYKANCAGKSSHEITWDEVKQRNLGPCGTCVLK